MTVVKSLDLVFFFFFCDTIPTKSPSSVSIRDFLRVVDTRNVYTIFDLLEGIDDYGIILEHALLVYFMILCVSRTPHEKTICYFHMFCLRTCNYEFTSGVRGPRVGGILFYVMFSVAYYSTRKSSYIYIDLILRRFEWATFVVLCTSSIHHPPPLADHPRSSISLTHTVHYR